MGYSQLTYREREFLMTLRQHGHSVRKIAEALRRSPSTVSRELERNSLRGEYNAATADRLSQARKRWGGHCRNGNYRPQYYWQINRLFQYRKLPRTHIAWRSDLNEYYRHRGEPDHFFMNVLYPRSRSLFRRKDKPWHFTQMNELAELLMERLAEEKTAILARRTKVISITKYPQRQEIPFRPRQKRAGFRQTRQKSCAYGLANTG
ncbi:hypothetical protein FUAX_07020 [Fulvitalea axinellae]|uniref:Transposase IS30-like HTH domain-containing protein n=1 Tax=Fulvitalea axinellae TaxID=1182444 RepID=A0AAU9CGC7_9BACT|nr:hypothetical protein FUAX_07020 [Fulvitalea axinellae]